MGPLGSQDNPLRVAVIGSGPSGFYAAEALLKSARGVRVDMLERLPSPYGLVRSGVAPDHPKLKQAILVYDKIARAPEFTYIGNVAVGKDISVGELCEHYHALLFTCGAESDRRLGVPGEDLQGSYTATEFVGWYNGHPDYRDRAFDLSHEVAVIIGQGNVAADVARILAKGVDELKHTDIAQHALDELAQSRVREIHVIGRRGPAQAKFTNRELREFGELKDCDASIDARELVLNPESQQELEDKNNVVGAKNLEIFKSFTAPPGGKRRCCVLRFLQSPVRLLGEGRLERLVLERNRLQGAAFGQSARGTGETSEQACGILFRSIGYRGVAMPGVPFDEKNGVMPNLAGRVIDPEATPVPGLYCAGWIKRGPTGIIGTNRADSVATVESLLADLPRLDRPDRRGADAVLPLLAGRGVQVVDFTGWLRIDATEVERGKPKGKPREKITRVAEMLAVAT
ncbi:MAG: NAD(P)-binding protein [Gammaproteobacteria bacterium]